MVDVFGLLYHKLPNCIPQVKSVLLFGKGLCSAIEQDHFYRRCKSLPLSTEPSYHLQKFVRFG